MTTHRAHSWGSRATTSVFRGWLIGMAGFLAACVSSGAGDDQGYNCKAPPADVAACTTDADCTVVTGGCFCGAQPLTGVSQARAADAQACETAAASMCALGCANQPGYRAQDGNHADSSSMILVRCNASTSTCTTYVP